MVVRSSAEAEFKKMCQGICDGIWLGIMLEELGLSASGSTTILCDNKTAI